MLRVYHLWLGLSRSLRNFSVGLGIDMKCRKGVTLVRSIATHRLECQNFVFIAFKPLLRRTHRTYPLGMYRSAPLVYSGIVDLAISSSENEKARLFLCVLNPNLQLLFHPRQNNLHSEHIVFLEIAYHAVIALDNAGNNLMS